mmetsp:Transcript_413/g.828  ORF Transcript_413/g.828 Transcript_413/m.828 type:complete len:80 (-) Transcript_413:1609-1848(-)
MVSEENFPKITEVREQPIEKMLGVDTAAGLTKNLTDSVLNPSSNYPDSHGPLPQSQKNKYWMGGWQSSKACKTIVYSQG